MVATQPTNRFTAALGRAERLHTLTTLAYALDEMRQGRVPDQMEQAKLISDAIEVLDELIAACEE